MTTPRLASEMLMQHQQAQQPRAVNGEVLIRQTMALRASLVAALAGCDAQLAMLGVTVPSEGSGIVRRPNPFPQRPKKPEYFDDDQMPAPAVPQAPEAPTPVPPSAPLAPHPSHGDEPEAPHGTE